MLRILLFWISSLEDKELHSYIDCDLFATNAVKLNNTNTNKKRKKLPQPVCKEYCFSRCFRGQGYDLQFRISAKLLIITLGIINFYIH